MQEELQTMLKECHLCPRNCGVDRLTSQKGFCGVDAGIMVARAALHMWEEPCISGTNGSGAVFFSGCTLRCVYCQNYHIANSEAGKTVSVERLSEIFLELQEQGANNINLVTPTHFVPQIIAALDQAREKGFNLPIVYNTSGYEKVETLKRLDGYVDIYPPNFKYLDPEHAKKYSGAEDYPEVAKRALAEMVRQTGVPQLDEQGIMKKGVIVRHLLLPGCLRDARRIVKYLYETYGDQIYMSLMNQYTPLDTLNREKYPELAKKVTKKAYDVLVDYAIDLGVEQAFIQEGETAIESFIPDFSYEGV